MTTRKPKISVIVPVYGVEQWLPACVESILAQTFADFELILVDDGSPDNCPALCDGYAAKDERVRVIHRENGGLSAARNTGLDAVAGEYICFVDSDDVIAPRYLELLLSAGADVAQCGFCRENMLADDAVFERLTGREMSLRMHNDAEGACTVAWNRLWRRSVWGDLRFPEGKLHEDEFTTWRGFWAAETCAVTDAPLYYYRQRSGSIMDGGFTPRRMDAVDALRERAAFYRAQGDLELAALADTLYCHTLKSWMKDIRKALPGQYEICLRELWRAFASALGGKITARKKLALALHMLSPALYRRLKGEGV